MFTLGPREFLVGLGSNAPDSVSWLRRARLALAAQEPSWKLLDSSALYESDALLPEGAPPSWNQPFLNAACLLRADEPLEADALVSRLKAIEHKLGREPAPRWSPRTIDLDLLDWGLPPSRTSAAQVPHAGLLERPFALLPALDCAAAPGALHPWRYADPDQVPFRTRSAAVAWSELVAILNLTPDSFSGGQLDASNAEIEAQVRSHWAGGATVLDVGAESTRPQGTPIEPAEEWRRLAPVLPLLARLRAELGFKLSLDTRNAETAKRALAEVPIDWLNDVEGFSNPAMLEVAARSQCEIVFMHSMGVPPSRERTLPRDLDPIQVLRDWANARIRTFLDAGIAAERLIFDPGIGFGKTPTQNLEILRRASDLALPGVRLLIGHSRKRFLDPDNSIPSVKRDLETGVATAPLARSRVDYVRVHTPALAARALRLGMRMG